MQYLVKAQGNTSQKHEETYIIKAKNSEIAAQKATELFKNENDVLGAHISVSEPRKRTGLLITSILLMLFAIFLSFIGWRNGHESFDLKPNLFSGVFAIAFYCIYVVRYKGLNNLFSSVLDSISVVVIITLLSCLFSAILVTKRIDFVLFKINVDSIYLIGIGLLMSACSLKPVSVVFMILTCLLSLGSIVQLNAAMGVMGFVFILCSLLGLFIYMSIDPIAYNIIPGIVHASKIAINHFNNDLNDTKHIIDKKISSNNNKLTEGKDSNES